VCVFVCAQQDWTALQEQIASGNVLGGMLGGMPSGVRPYYDRLCLATDVVNLLFHVARPNVRTVAPSLLSPWEKAVISQAGRGLASFGVTLQPSRDMLGNPTMEFDPALDTLCQYKELADTRPASYSVLQLIGRLARDEQIRATIDSAPTGSGGAGGAKTARPASSGAPAVASAAKRVAAAAPPSDALLSTPTRESASARSAGTSASAASTVDISPISKAAQVPRDFFGRPIASATAAAGGAAGGASSHAAAAHDAAASNGRTNAAHDGAAAPVAPAEPADYGMRFKFHEGFTNAVRRPLLLSDLLR
jgi:hypothetical protein